MPAGWLMMERGFGGRGRGGGRLRFGLHLSRFDRILVLQKVDKTILLLLQKLAKINVPM